MSRVSNLILYAGPTLAALSNSDIVQARGFKVLPPVQRGNLSSLCGSHSSGLIVIVDGVFHNALAVSHAEIRNAINQGWLVWGVSSIGAIRAYEMRNSGMFGFGDIFDLYCQEEDFQDDEVALIHENIPPYRMLSEPLVHIRTAVKYFQDHDLLTNDAGHEIINSLKKMWFGERTLQLFEKKLEEKLDSQNLTIIRSLIKDFDLFRIKTIDLEKFLRNAPYLQKFKI